MGRLLASCAVLLLAGCGGGAGNGAAGGLDRAALLTASCSGCHAGGGSPEGIVPLDGMGSAELEAKLLGYRNDAAGGSAMHRMARGYTDDQIALIAATLGQ